jgi:hypothetical protein
LLLISRFRKKLRCSISCRVFGNEAKVEIEEQFNNYRPLREWYELVVFAGGKVLQQQVRAGQGLIRVQLG